MKQLTQSEFKKGARNYENIASPQQDAEHEQIKFMAVDEFGNLQYSQDGVNFETIQSDGKVKPLTSLTPVTSESELPEGNEGDAYAVLTNGNLPLVYYVYTTEWENRGVFVDNTLVYCDNLLYIYNESFNGYFAKTSYTDTAELTNGANFVNTTQLNALADRVTVVENDKLNKSTATKILYGTDANGDQARLEYTDNTNGLTASTIVQRMGNGGILVRTTPTSANEASSKNYVDNQVVTKQDALSSTQLDAVNSGIDSTKVNQITTNANNIATNTSNISNLQTTVSNKQDKLTQTQLDAVNSGIDTTKVEQITTNADNISTNTTDIGTNTSAIATINGKIPNEATVNNQLADKDFVNSSINAFAAYYITKNAQGDPFATKAELNNATTFYSGGVVRVPTTNDYCIVLADESQQSSTGVDPTTRYTYQGNQWEFQYKINDTPLTAAQLSALNSGITSTLVGQIGTNQTDIGTLNTNKQNKIDANNKLSADLVDDTNATNKFVTASDKTIWNGKQDALISGTNIKTINGNSLLGTGDIVIQAGQQVDVQVDGTSIVSNDVANLHTINSDYNATTNPLATQSDLSNIDLSTKMDKANPTGTGSLSLNRKANTTIGTNSVAVGNDCEASGAYSHAEGYNTRASNGSAHAEGSSTTASGAYSHAEGSYTTAQRKSQHTFGEYNVLDTAGTTNTRGDYVEIVGNGTADNARSNARTLDWSGNEWLAGSQTAVGGYNIGSSNSTIASVSGTNLTLGNSSLATNIAGSGTRPTYNSNSLALYNDVPTNVETTTNKVTSLSSNSTDTQYPSAKCVYDLVGDVETLLTALNSGSGV